MGPDVASIPPDLEQFIGVDPADPNVELLSPMSTAREDVRGLDVRSAEHGLFG